MHRSHELGQRVGDGELSEILRLMVRRWPTVALSLVGALAASLGYYVLSDRLYEAEIIVQPAQDVEDKLRGLSRLAGGLGSLAGISGLTATKGGRYDQTIALLNSIGFFASFDSKTGFRHLLEERNRGFSVFGSGPQDLPSIVEAHDLFHANYFAVVEDTGTSVVWLRLRNWDPKLAAEWLELIVSLVNETVAERELMLANTMLGYLNAELTKTQNIETQQAISALIRRETERRMLASVTKDYALIVIDHARPPSRSDFVSPNLAVCVLLGVMVGILGASIVIVVRNGRDGAGG